MHINNTINFNTEITQNFNSFDFIEDDLPINEEELYTSHKIEQINENSENETTKTVKNLVNDKKRFLPSDNENSISPKKIKYTPLADVTNKIKLEEPSNFKNDESSDNSASSEFSFYNKIFHEYANKEPIKWYPVNFIKNAKKIDKNHEIRQLKNIIYIFKNNVNNIYYIGKTENGLKKRCLSHLNSKPNLVESDHNFHADLKKDPDHFSVGILHVLKADEDINHLEDLYIKSRKIFSNVYNSKGGGGGGSSHSQEKPIIYGIDKNRIFTPKKYYPFKRGDQFNIRIGYSPGFFKSIDEDIHTCFIYTIKNMTTGQNYVGASNNPHIRSLQHCYSSEYFVEEHRKFDPNRIDGLIHPILAAETDQFAFGLLPVKEFTSLDDVDTDNYFIFKSRAELERFAIQARKAFGHGYNRNAGGGGPIANPSGNKKNKNCIKNLTFKS